MNGDPKAYTFAKKSQSNVGHLNMTVELTRYNETRHYKRLKTPLHRCKKYFDFDGSRVS